ncbi:protein TIFY 6b [Dendrobium catenatum]|uniref:protein TIFY 6b n=1 Tax=Dendrobium catenatum TaxID=906689 RepID=UPI0010A08C53|nr:protein TIFY 6b [Dendrobium catenatum]
MERDFLGVGGRNSRAFVMEENLGGRLDSAFSVSSAVHWPFLNRTSALQNFLSFETSGEDKRKKLLVEPASVDAFKASNTVCSVNATEKKMGMERHGVTQFSMHASTQSFNYDSFTAMSHSSIPVAMTSPFLNSHGSSNGTNPTATAVKQQPFASDASLVKNVVGAFTPRNAEKPRTKNAQLTIFYAGSVNVYDDVPSHMAQAIMLTASRECKTSISSGHPRSDAYGLNLTTETLNNTANHLQLSCSEIKTGIEAGLADDKIGAKSIAELILTSKNEPGRTIETCIGASSATIMPRAVPQARKASLARFLQKRKERVSNMIPYSSERKNPDSSTVLEGAPTSSKFSSTDASISSNKSDSWQAGQTKSCSDSDESPSTKLEM